MTSLRVVVAVCWCLLVPVVADGACYWCVDATVGCCSMFVSGVGCCTCWWCVDCVLPCVVKCVLLLVLFVVAVVAVDVWLLAVCWHGCVLLLVCVDVTIGCCSLFVVVGIR